MTDNLYEENNGGGEFAHQTIPLSSVEKPPLSKNETNLSGLQNQGATCYLNVLIQTLLYTPEFREPLFHLTPTDLNLPSNLTDQNSTTYSGKVRKIIVELQRLFAEMLLLNQQACSSIRLTDSFGWQSHEAIDHQDVHELNRLLFDAIQKSLQGTRQANLIRSCYEGSTVNYTQCKQCQKIFKRIEDYQDLPLVVQDSPNLETSLANIFTIRESLVGDNQYRCSACSNGLCDAEKWAKISKLPPILTLPLQRFVYDIKTGNRQKKTTRYEFPFEIDLKDFCEESVTETNYELFAVVIHQGTCYTGHYYGYIKDVDQIGVWKAPPTPRSSSQPATTKSPGNNRKSNESAGNQEETMQRVDQVRTLLLSYDDWVTTDYLLQTYKENIGSSWGQTRGSRGTFIKFLRNHPKVFEVDDKRVRLVQQDEPMDIDESAFYDMDCQSSDDHQNEHWFCFDDSTVTCVTRATIQKHYGLSDCAYMLFYRHKNRRNTSMNHSTTTHSIPPWLLDEITEKNRVLKEKREVYEKYQNQFWIIIYPGEWFQLIDNCRLNFNNNEHMLFPDRYGEHFFDKRMKINDFLSKFEDNYGIGSHFYIAKKLRSGQLHVISELIYCSNDRTLDKTDLTTYHHLIVYKSPSSLPDTVVQGEEFEPIALNIVYGFPDAQLNASRLQPTKHVSKNTTLSELKEMLYYDYYHREDPQKLRQIRMGKINFEEKNNRKTRREYKTDEEKQTLTQLHLQDGDTLGIDDRNSSVSNWKDASSTHLSLRKNQYSLTIKNSLESNTSKPMTCSCSNDTLIGEVKLRAIQAFDLPLDPETCRLYIDGDPDVAHIPLYDHQTVDSIEFKANNTSLCLKFGPTLKENDLLLYILSNREPSPLELVIDQDSTLRQLWSLIKQELRMNDDDNDYHLSEVQTTTNGEDADRILNDFDQTLARNQLYNGAQLTMKLGSVPTKNHVRLRIFRIIDKNYQPDHAIHTVPNYEMVDLDILFELPLISPFNLLREKIATHIEFHVPSNYVREAKALEFIRLYGMQDDQPSSLIHEPLNTTLKQAKVKDLDTFAFELLNHPESLAKNDLLLNIVYDKDENDIYFQHHFEIHWPLKEGIPAKYEYLEQHVINNLTSFMKNNLHFQKVSKQAMILTFARYFPDQAKWLVIDSRQASSSQPSNKKNKTSNNQTKSNLRSEPYRLRDLAVIGVLEGDQLTIDHFDTPYDKKQRNEIEHEAEQQRNGRGSKESNGAKTRRRSPQNTMRIDVDDFEN